jgi:hypothetical protein
MLAGTDCGPETFAPAAKAESPECLSDTSGKGSRSAISFPCNIYINEMLFFSLPMTQKSCENSLILLTMNTEHRVTQTCCAEKWFSAKKSEPNTEMNLSPGLQF